MPSNYTGTPSATQAPAAAPGPNVAPILALPIDADSFNSASTYQQWKTLADYVAYLNNQALASVFGDGSDSDVVITVNTSLTRDMFYRNLTVSGVGTVLDPTNFRIFVSGTLTIAASCKIGPSAFSATDGTLKGCAAFVTGGSGGAVGTNGNNTTSSLGATAGAGGTDGAGHAGGTAGTATAPTAGKGSPRALIQWGGHILGIAAGASLWTPISGGGSGGGGGGAAASVGGFGGDGGPVTFIAARAIVLAAASNILANGNAGGTATGSNAGGGGGGGGGCLLLAYGSKALSGGGSPVFSAATNCAGGAGGAKVGTGVVGSTGSNGTVVEFALA